MTRKRYRMYGPPEPLDGDAAAAAPRGTTDAAPKVTPATPAAPKPAPCATCTTIRTTLRDVAEALANFWQRRD